MNESVDIGGIIKQRRDRAMIRRPVGRTKYFDVE